MTPSLESAQHVLTTTQPVHINMTSSRHRSSRNSQDLDVSGAHIYADSQSLETSTYGASDMASIFSTYTESRGSFQICIGSSVKRRKEKWR